MHHQPILVLFCHHIVLDHYLPHHQPNNEHRNPKIGLLYYTHTLYMDIQGLCYQ
jgi:hypothetical protein